MASFTGCRVTVAYDDGRPALEDDDSDLQLAPGRLLLSFWDERGAVVLVGSESDAEPGCFELSARSRPRRGVLRREDSRTFIGHWVEGEERGSLRVEIAAGDASGPEEDR